MWGQDGEIPVLLENMAKRKLFSVCDKVARDYAVAGWLRTTCNFVKTANVAWDEKISDYAQHITNEVVQKVANEDSVRVCGKLRMAKLAKCSLMPVVCQFVVVCSEKAI